MRNGTTRVADEKVVSDSDEDSTSESESSSERSSVAPVLKRDGASSVAGSRAERPESVLTDWSASADRRADHAGDSRGAAGPVDPPRVQLERLAHTVADAAAKTVALATTVDKFAALVDDMYRRFVSDPNTRRSEALLRMYPNSAITLHLGTGEADVRFTTYDELVNHLARRTAA